MSLPRMSLHIGDYKKDTGHLRAAGHGAYCLLIMHYWATGGLPDNDRELASIACMSLPEWKRARPLIEPLFKAPGRWRHKRINKELAAAQAKYEKRANAGREGGRTKAENARSNATAKPYQPITDNRIDDGGEDAGARGQISKAAFSISEKLYAIFGLDPEFIPPGWCGAPRWVQKCLNEGIPQDVIISSAEGVNGRKRDGPPSSFNYLEKPLARDWANHNAPLPTVQLVPHEPIREAPNGHQRPPAAQSNGIVAAGKRRLAELADFARGSGLAAEGDAGDAARDPDVRLLSSR